MSREEYYEERYDLTPPGTETRVGEPHVPETWSAEYGQSFEWEQVQRENPMALSSDLYMAQWESEHQPHFGLHEDEPWRDTGEGPAGTAEGWVAGQMEDDVEIEATWQTPVPSTEQLGPPAFGEEDPYPGSEAGLRSRPPVDTPGVDELHIEGRPRNVGEGPQRFEGNGDDLDGIEDEIEGIEEAGEDPGFLPMRLFEPGVRDIEVMWGWLREMDAEQVLARAQGWEHVSRLLGIAAGVLRGRGETLMTTWQSSADNASASNSFLARADATHTSMLRWEWIAERNASSLNTVGQAIRNAQEELGPLHTHYRVALALLQQWSAVRDSDQPPGYASWIDTDAMPPIGDLEHQPGDSFWDNTAELASGVTLDITHPMRINDPSAEEDPRTTPVLYDGSSSHQDIGDVEKLLEVYHQRTADIVQPLADVYWNEARYYLTIGRAFEGPQPQDIGMPIVREFDQEAFRDQLLEDLNLTGPGLGPGLGPDGPPSAADVSINPDLTMPVGPGMTGPSNVTLAGAGPDGGFLAGMPVGLAGLAGGPGLVAASSQQAAAQQATAQQLLAQQQALGQQQVFVQQQAVTQQQLLAQQQAAAAAAALRAGQPGPAAAHQMAATGAPVRIDPALGSGAGPTGTPGATPPPAALRGATGLVAPGEAGTATDPTGSAVTTQGPPALPGATAGQPGSGLLMPPPPPPMMPPMTGQPGATGAGGAARGTGRGPVPGAPPMFVPPGRTTGRGRTPVSPVRLAPTLAGVTGRAAATAAGRRGLAGAPGAPGNPAAPPAATPRPPAPAERAEPAPPESVPTEQDRQLWTVKKPKGVLQGSAPPQPAAHGRAIGA